MKVPMFLVMVLVLVSPYGHPTELDATALAAYVDGFVTGRMRNEGVGGVTVAIIKDGQRMQMGNGPVRGVKGTGQQHSELLVRTKTLRRHSRRQQPEKEFQAGTDNTNQSPFFGRSIPSGMVCHAGPTRPPVL